MWLCKSHYYNAEYNFYNFPYAFGQLFSLGLYVLYEQQGAAFPARYAAMLRATGKANLADVAKLMDIDIRGVDFWRSSLKAIARDIDKFVELVAEAIDN
jgi:oligoendopeptidase F